MVLDSLPISISVMHVPGSVKHIIGWIVVISWVPWPELLVASNVVYVVVTAPTVLAVVSLIVVFLVSCGHLAVGVVVVVISWSSCLVIVPVRPVVFRWSCSFIVVSVLSICDSVFHFHEFYYYFWFYPTHLFGKICSTEPLCKGINCSLVRDILDWIFDYTLAFYVWTECLPYFLGASFEFLSWW
jgi:hypothetical protein